MPYTRRKTYRRRAPAVAGPKRRTYHKRKTYRRRQKPLERGTIVRDTQWGLMPWSVSGTYNAGAGSAVWPIKTIRLNSLYDPDYAVGGTQPMGLDQLATLYTRYLVTSIKASVWATNQSAASKSIVIAFYITPDTSPTISGIDWLMQQPRCRYMIIPGGVNTAVWPSKRLSTGWLKLSRMYGRKFDDAEDSALVSDNPSTPMYMHIIAATLDGSVGTSYMNGFYTLRFTYRTKFYRPATLPVS